MNKPLPAGEYNEFRLLLEQTSNAIVKASEAELKRIGISAARATALFTIKGLGARATTSEISR